MVSGSSRLSRALVPHWYGCRSHRQMLRPQLLLPRRSCLYRTTRWFTPSLLYPSCLSPIQEQRACQGKLYLTSTLPDSLHSTQAGHSGPGGCIPQAQGSKMILRIGSLKGNSRARMTGSAGDQERHKALLSPNSHPIELAIIRAASPVHRAFHSASLSCMLRGIQRQNSSSCL